MGSRLECEKRSEDDAKSEANRKMSEQLFRGTWGPEEGQLKESQRHPIQISTGMPIPWGRKKAGRS